MRAYACASVCVCRSRERGKRERERVVWQVACVRVCAHPVMYADCLDVTSRLCLRLLKACEQAPPHRLPAEEGCAAKWRTIVERTDGVYAACETM